MKRAQFAGPALMLALLGTPIITVAQQYGPPQGLPTGYGTDRDHERDQDRDRDHGPDRGGWDAPPNEYREFQRQGFHDGIEGARRDVENHRRPDVNNRDEFRHPNVPRNVRHDYRDAFRRGYQMGIEHILGGGPRPY